MKPISISQFLTIFLLLMLAFPLNNACAEQQNEEVRSLGEILNPKTTNHSSISLKDRGNIYFDKCMQSESLAFDKEEKELLCACTAAKQGDFVTAEEFLHLYKDTKKGKDARLKLITYGYTECMDYAIQGKIYKDCRVLPLLKSIRYGKDHICKCTVKHFDQLLYNSASHLIMEGIKYDPMTLNPLERFFTTDAYYSMLSNYTKFCRSKILYEKNN